MRILLDYKKHYNFYAPTYNGLPCTDVYNGANGAHADVAGGNGQNGEPGRHGCDGQDGARGNTIEVFADAYNDSILQTTLVYIELFNRELNEVHKYLLNPDGGGISVFAKGAMEEMAAMVDLEV
jgi:hypothetical protein